MQVTQATINVWDLPVRLFHWTLASAFFIAYLSADEVQTLHEIAGYTVAALVLFRLVWGVIGTRYARFSQFVKGPHATADYLKQMAHGKAPRHLGHNPAGAAMIIALLLALVGTTLAGMTLLATDGHGPLAGTFLAGLREHTVEEVHEFFANSSIFLVFLHVAGVITSSLMHRENLVRAMINGRKRAPSADPATVEPRIETSRV